MKRQTRNRGRSSKELFLTLALALFLAPGCNEELMLPEMPSPQAERALEDQPIMPPPIVYQCTVGESCVWPVSTRSLGSGRYVLTADMSASRFRRMDVFSLVCNPTGWTLHLADSPTSDGGCGDDTTTDHDAEAYLYNSSTVEFCGTMDFSRGQQETFLQTRNASPASGCNVVHFAAYHALESKVGTVLFEGRAAPKIDSIHGMKLDYRACLGPTAPQRGVECDWEDAGLADAWKWYVGVNTTVGFGRHTGDGAKRTCIVLSNNVSYSPRSCLGEDEPDPLPID